MSSSRSIALMMLVSSSSAVAQGGSAPAPAAIWPDRPIRLIAPVSPGGGGDFSARLLAKSLAASLRQPVLVDNRPGGGGVLGTALAAQAPADGYTVLWVSGSHAISAAFERNLPYDPVKSFEPVALFAKLPFILVVSPSLNVSTMPELIARLRANPGKLNYASSGIGSISHVGLEMLKLMAKVDMVNVNFKGAAPSIAALLSGEVQMAMLGPLSVKPQIANGRLRALAVSTAKRSPALPGVPTFAESGVPGYEVNVWFGILAPAGTPREIVARLNAEMVKIMRTPEITDRFVSINSNETTTPKAVHVDVYQGLQQLQEELARSLRPAFAQHRRLVG
jgi:tripartite-type tricarboxylate transporter receptor subunit TctC